MHMMSFLSEKSRLPLLMTGASFQACALQGIAASAQRRDQQDVKAAEGRMGAASAAAAAAAAGGARGIIDESRAPAARA